MALDAQNLMPLPAKILAAPGRLAISPSFQVSFSGYQESRLHDAAERLIRQISRETGIPAAPSVTALTVRCDGPGEPVQSVREAESYRLTVTPAGATLTSRTPVGALRGMATFAQLVDLAPEGFGVPGVDIEDAPRFPWRGLMLEPSRHWMPPEVIKRNLDAMAAVKLNVMHFHLSDDQGFRVESKRYPKLQELGSDGHYYTQEQIRQIVAYARELGIRVVPEFDIPGHTTAWLAAYPELAAAPGPYQIERKWGVLDPCMDPTNEEVYRHLDGFIGEMAGIFPDEYFHIGGDEVNGRQWNANPRIQAFLRAHNMKGVEDLQAYFNRRVQAIVAGHGKKMIGWDEILRPDLPKDVMVQSWRGQKSLAAAAEQGYSGILSSGYYLDLMRHADEHYLVDPIAGETASLTDEQKRRILGGEACMWSELVTPENVDSRIWPRMAAIAERFWSPAGARDVDSMYRRLEFVSRKLDWAGAQHLVGFRRMTERLAGSGPVEPVRTLAEVVEPVKNYTRHSGRPYTIFTPLNRMVDAARAESPEARAFGKAVDALLAKRGDAAEVRRWLTLWRDNDTRLKPGIRSSGLLAEVAPLSEDLAALATAGLTALDCVTARKHAGAPWVRRQTALLDRAAKPRAELLLSVVPPMRKLIEAAR